MMLELTTIIYEWLKNLYKDQYHKIEVITYHHWGDEIILEIQGLHACSLVIMETIIYVYGVEFKAADPKLFEKLEKELASRTQKIRKMQVFDDPI